MYCDAPNRFAPQTLANGKPNFITVLLAKHRIEEQFITHHVLVLAHYYLARAILSLFVEQ